MKKYKHFSKKDIEILKEWEVPEEDISQMDDFYGKTYYHYIAPVRSNIGVIKYNDDNKERISAKKAREILGDEDFLSGLNRSTFHWSSERINNNGEKISFDSSRYWEKILF